MIGFELLISSGFFLNMHHSHLLTALRRHSSADILPDTHSVQFGVWFIKHLLNLVRYTEKAGLPIEAKPLRTHGPNLKKNDML